MAVERKLFDCICYGLTTIASNIKAKDGQDWTIVCRTREETYSYFAAKSNQWIYT
jgi:hypothetical protein